MGRSGGVGDRGKPFLKGDCFPIIFTVQMIQRLKGAGLSSSKSLCPSTPKPESQTRSGR